MTACANAIEPVAGGNNPGVRGGSFQVPSKILKDGGMFGSQGSKVVDGLIHAGGQARGGNIVAEDSAVHDVGEKSGLRNEFTKQMRNVFLAFGGEGFLIACAAAEGDDDYLSFFEG